jgi:hypothetical protein
MQWEYTSASILNAISIRFYVYWRSFVVQVYGLLVHWHSRVLSVVNYPLVVILLMTMFSRLNIILFWLKSWLNIVLTSVMNVKNWFAIWGDCWFWLSTCEYRMKRHLRSHCNVMHGKLKDTLLSTLEHFRSSVGTTEYKTPKIWT